MVTRQESLPRVANPGYLPDTITTLGSLPKPQVDSADQIERYALVIGGGALAIYGLSRGTLGGAVLALFGGGLIFKGITGRSNAYESVGTRQSVGASKAPSGHSIRVEKSFIVDREPAELYRFWRNFENLPQFMNHMESVHVTSDRHLHCVAKGPFGTTVEWDAEIINERENELIAWRSLENADINNAGSVRFQSAPGGRGTEVKVLLEYDPPAGVLGAAVAKLFGEEPNEQVEEDLRRFKQLMEAGEQSVTGGQPPRGRPPGGAKRINAWIAERETDGKKPLIVRQPYTLKLNVGEPHAGSLITAAAANVPLSEIPDEGLETVWVITSDSVEMAAAPPDNNVEVDAADASASWAVTFKLRIPKSGESDTRQLRVTPLVAQGAELGIVIFARNTLYRQFRIELKVREAPPIPGVADDPSVKVAGDVEHARLEYTGLMPQHEWQTPRGTLSICVVGNGKASVSGYVWNAAKQQTGWVGTHADWNLPLPKLAGRITNVRDSADKFRTKFSDELNNIDRQDLEERLSHFKYNTHTFWEGNRADVAHTQDWEQKIATSQELFDLAYYGYELYKTFFPDGTKLRLWLDSLEPDWRVNITWSEYIDPNWVAHVPWTLLYTRPPVHGQPVDPMYFWGLRYRLNYLAHNSDSGLSPALGGLDATASAYGFYWGDDDQEIVEEVKWQQAEWAKWGNQMFVPDSKLADSPKQQVLALFNKPPLKPTPVLYIFCHCEVGDGNKPTLRFGKTKSLADNIKQTDLNQTPFESGPLVFINACASAASDPYIANELEQTFFERGCRSYLGTVVKVPIRFASRFAKIFYSFFFRDLAPEPVAAGEAVFQACRFLWREYRNIGALFYAYINMYELYMATESEVAALHGHN